MKTIVYILFFCAGFLPVCAQATVLEQRISIILNDVSMEEAVEKIAEEAGINASYASNLLHEIQHVSVKAQDQTLLSVLNTLLAGYKISYTVHSEQLILFPKRTMVVKEYTFSGFILSETTHEPIPYSTLQVKGRNKGVVADHEGFFEFTINDTEKADTLLASCLGYERQSFVAGTLESEVCIYLREKAVELNPALITTFRSLTKQKTYGNRTWPTTGSVYLDTHGQQIALYIDNDKRVNGYIRKVSYYLSDKGNVEAPFRIRILAVDTAKNAPGDDLLSEILVVQPSQDHSGWYDVDVSEYRIYAPHNGFYVAMQGVFPNNYSFYAGDSDFIEIGKQKRTPVNDFAPQSIHYGQRLGYSGKNGRNTWHYSLSHQWFQMERHNYNVKISAEINILSNKVIHENEQTI